MRTSVGILGGITVLFVGFMALAESAGQTQSTAYGAGDSASSAWNMTNQIFAGAGEAAAPAIVWMGVGAFILVALGLLLAGAGGAR
jgi:hypothetical protein